MHQFTIDDIITGNKFKSIADDYIDESKPYIRLDLKPKIIFLYTDWLLLFKEQILPNINYSFTLITHNSDIPVTSDYIDILNNKFLVSWYGMNCYINHHKLHAIPIGIANEKWPHGNKNVLLDVANKSIEKKDRIYCNFNPHTTHNRRSIIPKLLGYDFIDFKEPNLSFHDYLMELKSYKWVISPPGNGVDCHRIWESIYMDTVPIVQSHACHTHWSDLPIQFVDDISNIDFNYITSQYDKLNTDKTKATFKYYKDKIL